MNKGGQHLVHTAIAQCSEPLTVFLLHAAEKGVLREFAPDISVDDLATLQRRVVGVLGEASDDSAAFISRYLSNGNQLRLRLSKRKVEIRKSIKQSHRHCNKQSDQALAALCEQIDSIASLGAALIIADAELSIKTPHLPQLEAVKFQRISQLLFCAMERVNSESHDDALLLFDLLVWLLLRNEFSAVSYSRLSAGLFDLATRLFTNPDVTVFSAKTHHNPYSICYGLTDIHQQRRALFELFQHGRRLDSLQYAVDQQYDLLFKAGFDIALCWVGQFSDMEFTVCAAGSQIQGTLGPKAPIEYFILYDIQGNPQRGVENAVRLDLALLCRIFDWFINVIFGFSAKSHDISIDAINPAKERCLICTPSRMVSDIIQNLLTDDKRLRRIHYWALLWTRSVYRPGSDALYTQFCRALRAGLAVKKNGLPVASLLAHKVLTSAPNPLAQVESAMAAEDKAKVQACSKLCLRYAAHLQKVLYAISLYYQIRCNNVNEMWSALKMREVFSDSMVQRVEALLGFLHQEQWVRQGKLKHTPPSAEACQAYLETINAIYQVVTNISDDQPANGVSIADQLMLAFYDLEPIPVPYEPTEPTTKPC